MPLPFFLTVLLQKSIKLLILLCAVSMLSFFLVSRSPIDPVDAYVGAAILKISPEQREIIEERWGLNKPPLERFWCWAGRLARGDFGISTIFNEPVVSVIAKRFVTSFWLMLLAWSCSGFLGFFWGWQLERKREACLIEQYVSMPLPWPALQHSGWEWFC